MLSITDIHQLEYTPDLTSTGVKYVLDALTLSNKGSKGADFDSLRDWVGKKAAELAFRRYLNEQKVPHDLLQTRSFGRNEEYSIQLGGRQCRLINQVISQRKDIRLVNSDLNYLYSANVVVPQNKSVQTISKDDLYIFSFITGLVTRSVSELKKSIAAGQPAHLVYQFPQAWAKPSRWKSLEQVVIKGDTQQIHPLTLAGQDKLHQPILTNLDLPIKERKIVEGDFFSLQQLQIDTLPSGAIGVHSPGLQYTLLIAPYQWGNLWVYGLKIFLLGFQSHDEFVRLAHPIAAGNSSFGIPRLSHDSLAMPIKKLRPISDLFTRARDWADR